MFGRRCSEVAFTGVKGKLQARSIQMDGGGQGSLAWKNLRSLSCTISSKLVAVLVGIIPVS